MGPRRRLLTRLGTGLAVLHRRLERDEDYFAGYSDGYKDGQDDARKPSEAEFTRLDSIDPRDHGGMQ